MTKWDHNQYTFNQILAVGRHVVPLWPGELVVTTSDPSLHARGDGLTVVGVEGGIPADPNNHMYIYRTLIGPGPTSFGFDLIGRKLQQQPNGSSLVLCGIRIFGFHAWKGSNVGALMP